MRNNSGASWCFLFLAGDVIQTMCFFWGDGMSSPLQETHMHSLLFECAIRILYSVNEFCGHRWLFDEKRVIWVAKCRHGWRYNALRFFWAGFGANSCFLRTMLCGQICYVAGVVFHRNTVLVDEGGPPHVNCIENFFGVSLGLQKTEKLLHSRSARLQNFKMSWRPSLWSVQGDCFGPGV